MLGERLQIAFDILRGALAVEWGKPTHELDSWMDEFYSPFLGGSTPKSC